VCFPPVVARRLGGFAVRASGLSTPLGISYKVSDNIKQAEEACKEELTTSECAVAWVEVEELSAATSHARDKLKDNSDPLENYCKENPEVDERRPLACRRAGDSHPQPACEIPLLSFPFSWAAVELQVVVGGGGR
jgi:hypothetical protein